MDRREVLRGPSLPPAHTLLLRPTPQWWLSYQVHDGLGILGPFPACLLRTDPALSLAQRSPCLSTPRFGGAVGSFVCVDTFRLSWSERIIFPTVLLEPLAGPPWSRSSGRFSPELGGSATWWAEAAGQEALQPGRRVGEAQTPLCC